MRLAVASKKIGSMLKEGRRAANLTQRQVAESLKYKKSQFISNIERGTCDPPIACLKKMVALYQLDSQSVVDELIKIIREDLEGKFDL